MIKTKKILILESNKVNQNLIKEQFLEYDAHCLFIIAFDKVSFLKKIQWFSYDFISSAEEIKDLTGEEALVFIKESLMIVPFVLISDSQDEKAILIEAVKRKIDAVVFKKRLNELPKILKEIAQKRAAEKKPFEAMLQKYNHQKLFIQRINEELSNTPLFNGKNKVLDRLKEFLNFN